MLWHTWQTVGEVKRKLADGVGILHTTSEHGVSSITTADAHTSAANSRLNWRPRRFKWPRPFRRKTKHGFCACAITFQLASTADACTAAKRLGSEFDPSPPSSALIKIEWTHNSTPSYAFMTCTVTTLPLLQFKDKYLFPPLAPAKDIFWAFDKRTSCIFCLFVCVCVCVCVWARQLQGGQCVNHRDILLFVPTRHHALGFLHLRRSTSTISPSHKCISEIGK